MTSREPTPKELSDAIVKITTEMVGAGLVDDQEWPSLVQNGRMTTVTTSTPPSKAVIKAGSYTDLYDDQARSRAFNMVMLDKALIQMSYEYDGRKLKRHRLAFLPSPTLVEFQNDENLYIQEQLYADVVGLQVTAVPIRFDYDVREGVADGVAHHSAHLTLGQYRHCRIPVTAALTPWVFIDFIVRHFYMSPDLKPLALELTLDRRFDLPSSLDLSGHVHLNSPGSRPR